MASVGIHIYGPELRRVWPPSPRRNDHPRRHAGVGAAGDGGDGVLPGLLKTRGGVSGDKSVSVGIRFEDD